MLDQCGQSYYQFWKDKDKEMAQAKAKFGILHIVVVDRTEVNNPLRWVDNEAMFLPNP